MRHLKVTIGDTLLSRLERLLDVVRGNRRKARRLPYDIGRDDFLRNMHANPYDAGTADAQKWADGYAEERWQMTSEENYW